MLNEIYDLFIDLDADESQLDFPVLYAVAKDGTATTDPAKPGVDLQPLFQAIVDTIPEATGDPDGALQILVANLDYSDISAASPSAGSFRARFTPVMRRTSRAATARSTKHSKARLRIPAKEPLTELVAWHRVLGSAGKSDLDTRPREGLTALSLLPPAPQTIHVVNSDGHGIGGLELGVSVRTEELGWISLSRSKRRTCARILMGQPSCPGRPARNCGTLTCTFSVPIGRSMRST